MVRLAYAIPIATSELYILDKSYASLSCRSTKRVHTLNYVCYLGHRKHLPRGDGLEYRNQKFKKKSEKVFAVK